MLGSISVLELRKQSELQRVKCFIKDRTGKEPTACAWELGAGMLCKVFVISAAVAEEPRVE